MFDTGMVRLNLSITSNLQISSPGRPGCRNIKAGGDSVALEESEGWYATYFVYRSFRYPPPIRKKDSSWWRMVGKIIFGSLLQQLGHLTLACWLVTTPSLEMVRTFWKKGFRSSLSDLWCVFNDPIPYVQKHFQNVGDQHSYMSFENCFWEFDTDDRDIHVFLLFGGQGLLPLYNWCSPERRGRRGCCSRCKIWWVGWAI